jgi:hypothetical protein
VNACWTFPTLNITLFLFSDLNVIYFLTNRTLVRNGLRDFLITLYNTMLQKMITSNGTIAKYYNRNAQIQDCTYYVNRKLEARLNVKNG